jgi:Na+/H+-dicarboxylate symporter
MDLLTAGSAQDEGPASQIIKPVPDNFFRALSLGHVNTILVGALIFGASFALYTGKRKNALMENFEGIYRTLERIISHANTFLPVVVFVTAAGFVATTDKRTLVATSSFLATFFCLSALVCSVALIYIWRRAGTSLLTTLGALKTPIVISLTAASTTAAIPDAIEGLATRLGFSRGLSEFIVPMASVFVRCGVALYFALFAIFVAQLYGMEIGPVEFVLIVFGASGAALFSAGQPGLASLSQMGFVLHLLNLPIEAAIPIALAIELLCEGLRSAMTLLTTCAIVAFTSERTEAVRASAPDLAQHIPDEKLIFSFSRLNAAIILASAFFAGILIIIAGIGVGMR